MELRLNVHEVDRRQSTVACDLATRHDQAFQGTRSGTAGEKMCFVKIDDHIPGDRCIVQHHQVGWRSCGNALSCPNPRNAMAASITAHMQKVRDRNAVLETDTLMKQI